jgi:Cytochrome c-type biogenesis protein CcmE
MLILISLLILAAAALLILFNAKKNIVFFYTPTELLEQKISSGDKIRIGGYVKDSSLKKRSLNQYEFKITDNKHDLLVFYKGILPDLF